MFRPFDHLYLHIWAAGPYGFLLLGLGQEGLRLRG